MLTAKGLSRTDRVGEIRRIGTAATTTRQRTQQGNNRQQHKPDKYTTADDNKREKNEKPLRASVPSISARKPFFCRFFARLRWRERAVFTFVKRVSVSLGKRKRGRRGFWVSPGGVGLFNTGSGSRALLYALFSFKLYALFQTLRTFLSPMVN